MTRPLSRGDRGVTRSGNVLMNLPWDLRCRYLVRLREKAVDECSLVIEAMDPGRKEALRDAAAFAPDIIKDAEIMEKHFLFMICAKDEVMALKKRYIKQLR